MAIDQPQEQRKRTDAMPDRLHLGCGDRYLDGYHNVDAEETVDPDEVVNLDDHPWPWPADSFAEIRGEHVFEHLGDVEAALRECKRLLEPGGALVMVWPMGVNARADPSHKHEWTWQTPEFYTDSYHWTPDTGLSLVDRSVDLHSLEPYSRLRRAKERYWSWKLRLHGPAEWCFGLPSMSGEFTVVFRNDG